jgi:glycosyltransferase involved in cell wall biosynthesis
MSRGRGAARLSVGVNLLWLGEGAGGIGRYAAELLPALLEADPALRLVAFHGPDLPAAVRNASWASQLEWVKLPLHRGAPRLHVLAQLGPLGVLARRHGVELLHSPATIGPPVAPGLATVVTLHDLIWLHEGDAWGSRRAQHGTRALFSLAAHRADRVLTDSRASREDIVATLRVDPAKVDVALLGVAPPPPTAPTLDVRSRYDLGPGPLVLSVAQKRPYKNLASLVRALPDLPADTRLLLSGAPTAHERELRALAAQLGVAERVRWLTYVPDDELEALYGEAACFVLPSFMEGFGLPVLEAMARGLPVACSDRWALPEVAGDAALLFDPSDQGEVTGAIRRLLADPALAESLAARGRARAAELSWRQTAEATLKSFARALDGQREEAR